ncbi:hypothetical protein GC098_28385 [Paenibacillus sp. LMG 31458]|uniref:Uncharacterized protein n=1 Tax=Paenibacillus phytorum TaxID=2654977 RepID=A0ABX1Y331_9BACL|nr:hypothetical protein [Paenibacillus phytorum]NOU75262.1 hypothetical protein [Paenibacillus phytorum]
MTNDENKLDLELTDSLTDNLLQIMQGLGNSNDVAIREIEIDLGDNSSIEGAVVYMEGLSTCIP